jgi:sterol desaturase/sphingolipid hydroxylase (fatty acid hydroxylase superfamily)
VNDLKHFLVSNSMTLKEHGMLFWQYWLDHHDSILSKLRVYGLIPLMLVLERIFPTRPISLLPKGCLSDVFHTYEPWVRAAVVSWLAVTLSPWLSEGYPKGVAAELPLWAGFVLALLVSEVGFYFIHRATHAFSWLWEFHRVHHSSIEYYSLMTSRFHVFDLALFEVPNIILFAWLAIPAEALSYFVFFRGFMDRYGHSNINGPRFTGYFIGSPHFHAWHHSRAPEAIDKNFGRDTVFMDYLFGTAYYPKDKSANNFGDPEFSNNYIVHQTLPFVNLFKRLRAVVKPERARGAGKHLGS